eukprot:XP_001698208.1 predicted protein [Chlamydomonas reinhardtii]
MEERPPTRAGGRRPANSGIPSAHNVGALPSLPPPTPSALLSPPSGATSSAGQQLSARVIATASASSSSTAATCTGNSPRCPSTSAASHTLMAPLASPRYGAAGPPLPLAQGVPPPPPPPSVLASAPPFARRSNTLNGGTVLDSIGLPGEEHGAMFEALMLEDDTDAACASEAATAAAASLAVNVSVRESAAGVSSGAEATAPGDGATQARFVPRPPDTPPPPSMQGRASTSGVVDGGGGDFSSIIISGGGAAAGEPPISPLLTHLRVQRRPTFTFGDKDGEGSGTGHAATPTTPSGGLAAIASGALSPASGGFGGGFGGAGMGGFVPASPRFARASTTIGISSAPLSTLARGVPLLPGETPSDPAAFGAGMPWPTTAAASGASSTQLAAIVMSTPTKTANGLDAARGGEEAYDAAQIEQLNSLLGFLESSSAAGSNDVKFQGLKQLGSLAAGSSGADLRGGSSAVSSGDGRNVAELPSLHRAASAATPERLSKMIPELAGGAGFVGAAPLAEDVGLGHGHPAGPAASGTSPAADIASLLQQQPGHGAEITKRTSSASYSSDGADMLREVLLEVVPLQDAADVLFKRRTTVPAPIVTAVVGPPAWRPFICSWAEPAEHFDAGVRHWLLQLQLLFGELCAVSALHSIETAANLEMVWAQDPQTYALRKLTPDLIMVLEELIHSDKGLRWTHFDPKVLDTIREIRLPDAVRTRLSKLCAQFPSHSFLFSRTCVA